MTSFKIIHNKHRIKSKNKLEDKLKEDGFVAVGHAIIVNSRMIFDENATRLYLETPDKYFDSIEVRLIPRSSLSHDNYEYGYVVYVKEDERLKHCRDRQNMLDKKFVYERDYDRRNVKL